MTKKELQPGSHQIVIYRYEKYPDYVIYSEEGTGVFVSSEFLERYHKTRKEYEAIQEEIENLYRQHY